MSEGVPKNTPTPVTTPVLTSPRGDGKYGNASGSRQGDVTPIAGQANFPDDEMVNVGRWMSKEEYSILAKTSKMIEGSGGVTFVSKGSPNSYLGAPKGSVCAEFVVPKNSLLQGGKADWFKVVSPTANKAMISKITSQGGVLLPRIRFLSPILYIK